MFPWDFFLTFYFTFLVWTSVASCCWVLCRTSVDPDQAWQSVECVLWHTWKLFVSSSCNCVKGSNPWLQPTLWRRENSDLSLSCLSTSWYFFKGRTILAVPVTWECWHPRMQCWPVLFSLLTVKYQDNNLSTQCLQVGGTTLHLYILHSACHCYISEKWCFKT